MDLLFSPVMLLAVLAPAAIFWRRHDLTEALALGALVALAGWSALAFARFLILLPPGQPRTIGLLALAISCIGALAAVTLLRPGRRSGDLPRPSDRVRVISICAGAALLVVGVEAAVPHFGIANLYYDWWEHFDLARFYSVGGDLYRHYQDGYTVTSRTPVFNLLTSLGLTAFGDRFAVFQVGTAALGWLWVLPAMLLARRFLRAQGQGLGLVALLALSPLLIFAAVYPWPKGLVTFFALLALDRFLALRRGSARQAAPLAIQFGAASGLSLMTHEGFIGYLLPLFALLLWDAIRGRARWGPLLTSCLIGLLVALPWYSWAGAQYGLHGGLIGYPEPGYASAAAWLLDHIVIVVSSVLPLTAFFQAYGDNWLQQLFVAYLRTAIGLLGLAFFIRVLARSLRRPAEPRDGLAPLLAFALAGVVSTTLLLNGWGNGWASAESVYIPAMVVLLIVALARAPLTRGMIIAAAIECLVVLAAAIAYLLSPASAGEANARLAAVSQVHFLGQDTWLAGIPLLLAGAGITLFGVGWTRPWEDKKEPRAEWHEAPLAS